MMLFAYFYMESLVICFKTEKCIPYGEGVIFHNFKEIYVVLTLFKILFDSIKMITNFK